jgi:hypothetical protein
MNTYAPLLAFSLLAACAGSPAARPSDFLHERITHVRDAVDGPVEVGFEHTQRSLVIDPVASPDHLAMIAFAKAAQASGKPVYATVAPQGPRTKLDDGPDFVLIRLADTPDPAATKR